MGAPAPSFGHPGIQPTITLISNWFWWPTLSQDVEGYVRSCIMCAQFWTSHQLPMGLLEPLPIPRHPWSHIAVDFITDLTSSSGYNTVMVAINWFSKACCLVPLKGLPTAMETATTLFHHVFRTYGLPDYIVLDWGLQFTSRVWSAFCTHLGVNESPQMYLPWMTGCTGARKSGKVPTTAFREQFADKGYKQTATDTHIPGFRNNPNRASHCLPGKPLAS
ncbi:hypothetical protein QTP86_005661 [Hemibagrus guttatus]|nr:hypothetical protein QTP86_005661 [Hemibagrus guttatus]